MSQTASVTGPGCLSAAPRQDKQAVYIPKEKTGDEMLRRGQI